MLARTLLRFWILVDFFFPLSVGRSCVSRPIGFFFSWFYFLCMLSRPRNAQSLVIRIYIFQYFNQNQRIFGVYSVFFLLYLSLHYLILLVGYGYSLANTMPFIPQFIRLLVFIVLDAAPLVVFCLASPRLATANLYRLNVSTLSVWRTKAIY